MLTGTFKPTIDYANAIKNNIEKPKKFFNKFWLYMQAALLDTYMREGARDELSPWTPLKPKTIRSKERKGYATPRKPLLATWEMALSFYPIYDNTRLEILNRKEYLIYHESEAPRTTLPQRRSSVFTLKDVTKADKMYLEHILKVGN